MVQENYKTTEMYCGWPRNEYFDYSKVEEPSKKILTVESWDGRVLFSVEVIKEERLQSAQ